MPARDPNISVLNYIEPGGAVSHIGGTLEIGNHVVFGVDANGYANVTGLPVADPHTVGTFWNNAGVLTISAG